MPKTVDWTPELVSRFWNGFAQIDDMKQLSFARLAGSVLVEFASPWIGKDARCLDYGGGSGHLVRRLVEAGVAAAAFEPSSARAREIAGEVGRNPLFIGTITADDPRAFDFVLCTEVIEHVLPGGLDDFARAIVQRLEVDGRLLLSTPYAEDLSQSTCYCPVCDSTFHRWQHQRTCRPADIRSLFEQHGLVTDWIGLVGFDDVNVVREFLLRQRVDDPWLNFHVETDGARFPIIGRGDHIVYVGRKVRRQGKNGAGPHARPDQEALIAAGIAKAAALGGRPVLVVPSAELAQVRKLRVDADVRAEGDRAALGEPGRVLVLPSSLASLEQAIDGGRVPASARAVVLEDGRWVPLRSSVRHLRRRPETPVRRGWLAAWIDRKIAEAGRVMRLSPPARRVQPWFDRREHQVLQALLHPSDFPLRMSHVVPRRVLLAIGTLGSGGAERQLINTAEGLAARGLDDVHILVNHLHDDPSNAFYLPKAEAVAAGVHASQPVDLAQFPWITSEPALRTVLGDGILARVLSDAKVIRALSPEIVHASLDWTNVTVGIAAVLAGVPHVFLSGRNLSPIYFPFFQWFMYPSYRALAECSGVQLLNNSDAGRRDYAAWLRIDASRIKVLRNGLHADEFPTIDETARRAAREKLGLAPSAKVVVGAFRLSAEKRPRLWIDTAAEIRAAVPDVVFLVCGVGPELEPMQRRAKQRGLDGAVQFLGSRKDIHTIFSAADLVLQTSLQEGTPNVLIEAQASGLPVVTTPAFGAAEAVEHGVTGFVVDADSATPIAQAALKVLADEAFRAQARAKGRAFIEERFGYARMIDDTLELYADSGAGWAAELLPPARRFRAFEELQNVYPENGAAWIAQLPGMAQFADSSAATTASKLILLENGSPLGPPHSSHDTIRQSGAGAYSHWHHVLYFSTSDGSDPRTNGRSYVAIVPRGEPKK